MPRDLLQRNNIWASDHPEERKGVRDVEVVEVRAQLLHVLAFTGECDREGLEAYPSQRHFAHVFARLVQLLVEMGAMARNARGSHPLAPHVVDERNHVDVQAAFGGVPREGLNEVVEEVLHHVHDGLCDDLVPGLAEVFALGH